MDKNKLNLLNEVIEKSGDEVGDAIESYLRCRNYIFTDEKRKEIDEIVYKFCLDVKEEMEADGLWYEDYNIVCFDVKTLKEVELDDDFFEKDENKKIPIKVENYGIYFADNCVYANIFNKDMLINLLKVIKNN